jgi:hypothetical protein
MKVIGVGFGRTGTLSLKVALEELGIAPCYHMLEALPRADHKRLWISWAEGADTDFDKIFDGYRATVDWPGCYFWRELTAAYPDAKVILTGRDPEEWYRSTFETIYRFPKAITPLIERLYPPARHMPRLADAIVWNGTFDGRFADKEYALEVYARHRREVMAEVPRDRLLVYDVRDGWGPLCEFLGVEVPRDRPFPRLNDRAEMQARMRRVLWVRRFAWGAAAGMIAAAGLFAWLVGRERVALYTTDNSESEY